MRESNTRTPLQGAARGTRYDPSMQDPVPPGIRPESTASARWHRGRRAEVASCCLGKVGGIMRLESGKSHDPQTLRDFFVHHGSRNAE